MHHLAAARPPELARGSYVEMAFVPAAPLGGRTHLGRAVARTRGGTNAAAARSVGARMAVEFQSYSGGLDRVSMAPYSITRYLFKPSPAAMTDEEKDVAVSAALRQVFGNAYLMEEERAELYKAESKYRCGELTAKEFVRAIAKSATYKSRFFDRVTQFRFIELNFKHLLGRAPHDQVEYSQHFKIFAEGGYDAEIDSYLDSTEYDQVFGDDVLPFTRFRGTYAPINQFNRMCSLEGGFAGSDKNKPQTLVTSLGANTPTPAHTVADGLPPIPNSEHPSVKYNLPVASLERYKNELELARAKALQINLELRKAYADLESTRNTMSSFKSMVADMDITPLYGTNYGSGTVKVFSGQYEGAPAGSWGSTGLKNVSGPTRKAAVVVGKKEKQLERIKQIILDLERRLAVQEAALDAPALTPLPMRFSVPGVVEEVVKVKPEPVEEPPVDPSLVDAEDEDSGIVVPKPIVVSTKRRIDDEVLGRDPGELMKEIEEEKKASGKDFLAGAGGKLTFPGDGSEMVIGS